MTVDDQSVFRRVARELIEATDGFAHLGEATCGEEALVLADELRPDLVLLDVCMPGIDGLETARRLRASHPVVDDRADLDREPRGSAGRPGILWSGGVRPQGGPWAFHVRRLWSEYGCRPIGTDRPPAAP